MKNIVSKVLVLGMVVAVMIPNSAMAAQTEPTENEFDYEYAYNWALEAGFSEGFLAGISEEALQNVYNDNVDVAQITIEESVETFTLKDGNQAGARGNIPESRLVLRKSAAKQQDANGRIKGYAIYFTAYWQTGFPVVRLTDAIATNWDSDVWKFKDDSFWGKIEGTGNGENGITTEMYSQSRAAVQNIGGLGWYVPLGANCPLGFTPTVRIGYQLEPKVGTLPDGSSYSESVTYTYAHQNVSFDSITLSKKAYDVTLDGHEDSAGDTLSLYHG